MHFNSCGILGGSSPTQHYIDLTSKQPFHLFCGEGWWRDIHLEESVKMTLDPDIKLYKSTLYEVKNLTEEMIWNPLGNIHKVSLRLGSNELVLWSILSFHNPILLLWLLQYSNQSTAVLTPKYHSTPAGVLSQEQSNEKYFLYTFLMA